MRWRGFCAELLAAADDLEVNQVVTLGALLAETPHTRPIPVTGTATEAGDATEPGAGDVVRALADAALGLRL